MGKSVIVILATVGLMLGLCSVIGAQGAPRSFDRFELDAETVRDIWAEVVIFHTESERNGLSIDSLAVAPRLVYGNEAFEGGIVIPYISYDVEDSFFFGGQKQGEDGIGDLSLYGKWIPIRTDWIKAGLGLDLSLPTGDEDKGLGAGETGFLPFGTVGVPAGPVEVRGHFGYLAYTGSQQILGQSFPANSFIYGGGLFVPFLEYYAARAEFVGQTQDTDHGADVVVFEPGVDIRFPGGSVDILIRPTGAIGLTDDSPDWGVGGSVVVAWNASDG